MHIIVWKDKQTGQLYQGEPGAVREECCEEAVSFFNRIHPHLHHIAVPFAPKDPKAWRLSEEELKALFS